MVTFGFYTPFRAHMKIDKSITDGALLELLGRRLARIRLSLNLTQQQLAEQAGLGLRTVQRLELGAAATQLSGFVRVCRVLGLVEGFETLIPEPMPSPVAQLKLRGKERKRASSAKPAQPAGPWQWGDRE
jgi:transcriptional regulator with XRE-family HTH domain